MKEHYKESFDLATAGGVTLSPEYNKIMSNVKGLTFNIFDDNGNLKPKDQFVAEYSSAARPIEMPYYRTLPNGNKVKLTLDYIKANRREFPNINDSQLANFNVQSRMFPGKISNTKYYTSKGQHYITYETKSTSIGGKYGGSSRDYMFNTEDAKIDGAEAYDAMYDVLIKTQNDTYNSQADEGAGKGTTSSAFTSYNMGEALRGNPAYTSAAEVVQNPTYIVDIIPKDFSLASIETIQLTRDFINQYNTTPKASTGLVMRTGETENYNDRSSPQANLAGRIIEKYLIELKAFSANPKLTGLTPSNATLKYQPVFGNAKEDKNYAAYTLSNIDAAWLKKNFADEFENDAMGGKARIYSDLTYAFDKNFDMSDRKQGRYNFSEVDNQINSTENHQYSYIVDNGGTFNITRGLDNEYNVRIQTQLFNPETNNMELQPAQTFNFNEYLATKNIDVTNNKDYGAYLIEQYLMEQKASNENASSANSKIKGKK